MERKMDDETKKLEAQLKRTRRNLMLAWACITLIILALYLRG